MKRVTLQAQELFRGAGSVRISDLVIMILLVGLLGFIVLILLQQTSFPHKAGYIVDRAEEEGALGIKWSKRMSYGYALYPDSTQLIGEAHGIIFLYGITAGFRLTVPSPYLLVKPSGETCRITFLRESLWEKFQEQCVLEALSPEAALVLKEGKERLAEKAKSAKALYEKFRGLRLVD